MLFCDLQSREIQDSYTVNFYIKRDEVIPCHLMI